MPTITTVGPLWLDAPATAVDADVIAPPDPDDPETIQLRWVGVSSSILEIGTGTPHAVWRSYRLGWGVDDDATQTPGADLAVSGSYYIIVPR